jgi:hypothetical protein
MMKADWLAQALLSMAYGNGISAITKDYAFMQYVSWSRLYVK